MIGNMYNTTSAIIMPLVLILIIGMGIVFRYTLKDKSNSIKNLPLTIIAIMLVILEITKQIYYITNNDWSFYQLPFHFCSFFIFWFVFAQFSTGKVQQLGYGCSLCGGILMTILFVTAPLKIIGDSFPTYISDFSSFHRTTYHFLIVAYWVWLVCLGLYKPNFSHILKITSIYATYYLAILICSYAFRTNFTNILESEIPIYENFRQTYGQVWYTITLFIFGVGMIALISTLTNLVYKKHLHNKLKLKEKYVE